MNKRFIEIAAQIGGGDAFAVVQPHIMCLKQAFASIFGPISDRVERLTYILRVDGEVRIWNLPAVSNIDLSLKNRYVSVDIAIPLSEWKKPPSGLASYIATTFVDALPTVLKTLEQSGVSIDADRLVMTLHDALSRYQSAVEAWPQAPVP